MQQPLSVRRIGQLLGPILFLILINIPSDLLSTTGWTVLAVASWMVIWWITEAIPIYATALLPLVLFPYLGVLSITEASGSYANPIIFLFMGGFILALGLEKHHLHQRIALNLIKITGTGANGIILGFMIATSFLSMWISNTATAVMMLPIATSVVNILKKQSSEELTDNSPFRLFALALFLSIAYSANIGGTATIIGTPPNVVYAGYLKEFYGYELEFSRWLAIGIPTAIILLTFTYLLLTKWLYPSGLGKIKGADQLIRNYLSDMGPIKKSEKLVMVVFSLTALAWIFKNPINGLLGMNLLNDTVTAMTGGILMFIVPINIGTGEHLLDWEDMKRLPWGILILFGGGICLASAMENAGLIQLIGEKISGYPQISGWILILILTTVMLFMTELMSNVALTTIFIPVVFGIANGAGIDPIVLSIPVTLAASCAFMMPISTPPNAIVFASGYIKTSEMVRAGIYLNIISIIVLFLLSNTLYSALFKGLIS